MGLPSSQLTPRIEALRRAHAASFTGDARPRVFEAPGRINIIGEHTDYSEGFVFPAAIDRSCLVAASPSTADRLSILTLNAGQSRPSRAELEPGFQRRGEWTDYVGGVRAALAEAGLATPGANLTISSNVPEGAGVSSSAALEVSVLSALLALAGLRAAPVDAARWAQRAESHFVGVPCGIMDQYVSVHGRRGHALALDCRTLSHRASPIPDTAAFLVLDSGVRHRLTDGGYEARRADCEAAAVRLGVQVLRDATPDMLAASTLPERLARRARHVVEENARVQMAVAALEAADLAALGELMTQSHASLRDLFNVTCRETDLLAQLANAEPGVHGARQMGGGFGGAVLALCDADDAEGRIERILSRYRDAGGPETAGFQCRIEDGAREITP